MRKTLKVKDPATGVYLSPGVIGAVRTCDIDVPDAALAKMELPLPDECGDVKTGGGQMPVRVRKEENGRYRLLSDLNLYLFAIQKHYDLIPAAIYEIDEVTFNFMEQYYLLKSDNLSYLEEAEAYSEMISGRSLTQDGLAEILGTSQSAVANKMRLLSLTAECRAYLQNHDLSERHARELLRIKDGSLQLKVLKTVVRRRYSVAQEGKLIDCVICALAAEDAAERKTLLRRIFSDDYKIKELQADVLKFRDELKRLISELRRAGADVKAYQVEHMESIEFVVKLPRYGLMSVTGRTLEVRSGLEDDLTASGASDRDEKAA